MTIRDQTSAGNGELDTEDATIVESVRSAPADHDVIPRGAAVGRYVVIGVAGRGGMGVVYRAYDPELQREVALKLWHTQGAPGSDVADARLRREAQAMARVSHPNVLPVYDAGSLDGQMWIAMEFLAVPTLGEWLAEAPRVGPELGHRPWTEILAMFVQAARGLAAAHAVGLVHRDFKPANVLVGNDGRARVMDFGLARVSSGDGDNHDDDTLHHDVRLSDLELTAVGSVVGTPRYMAPEQHYGTTIDARADQFALCVGLFEALYRVTAYHGKSLADLAWAKRSRALAEVQSGTDVPPRILRVLQRGLAPDPEQRFATIDALLDALAHDPGARRRRLLGWSAAAVITAGAMVGGGMWLGRTQACQDAARKLAGVWDDARRERVAAAMRATGLAYADDTWARVERSLDAYTGAWVLAHDSACAATKIHGEQSEDLLDARIACLERGRAELVALVDVLEQADTTVVERSVSAAAGLRAPSRCEGGPELLAGPRAPEDPRSVAAIADIEDRLARAWAAAAAGKPSTATALLQPAIGSARALGHPPLHAEVARALGSASSHAGDIAGGRALALESLGAALTADAGRDAALALTDLVYIDGYLTQHPERALEWAGLARGVVESLDEPAARVVLMNAEAITRIGMGDFAEGQRLAVDAIALQRSIDPDAPKLATLIANLGSTLLSRGRIAEGRAYLTEGETLYRRTLGADHPDTLRQGSNLGALDLMEGRYAAAAARLDAVLEAQGRALGPDHPDIGNTLNNLGTAHRLAGNVPRAIELHERAVLLRSRAHGPGSQYVAQSLENLAVALRHAGRIAEARTHHDRAAVIRRSSLPPLHPDVAASWMSEAEQWQAEGAYDAALTAISRALEIRLLRLGAMHGVTVGTRVVRAEILGQLGQRDAAIADLEQALVDASTAEVTVDVSAQIRFALARLLPDRARARQLALDARAVYAGAGSASERVAEIDAWLVSQPAGG